MTTADADRRRTPVTADPPNEQTPLSALSAGPTPLDLFYIRSNHRPPSDPAEGWAITIGGAVSEPAKLTVDDLRDLPAETITAVLECAGNGRTLMDPVPAGTPWDLGGVSVGEFTGTRLSDLLVGTRPRAGVVQWVATGADTEPGADSEEGAGGGGYAFPLDHDAAMGGDALLVWSLNGVALPRAHGGPVRLLVPGSYGMHAVKWLLDISATVTPFDGHYRRKYSYWSDPGHPDGEPLGPIAVRSVITAPGDGDVVDGGRPCELRGVAWSDGTAISHVDVDTGAGWEPATLGRSRGRYGPVPWSHTWRPDTTGRSTLATNATDAAGRTQPLESVWNANGYANNVVHRITVEVTGG